MTVNRAVRHLHNDLQKMRQAKAGEAKAHRDEKNAGVAEKASLNKIATAEQKIVDQFQSGAVTDPTVAAGLFKQMFSLGKQQAQVTDKFEIRVAHDHTLEKKDHSSAKKAHHQALHDLKPAEYQMGLKATNRVRHELGLKSVSKPIRSPAVHQSVGGQVGKWIAEAQTILKQHGIPLSKMNAKDINTIIKFESGGNPRAVNNWDSNAAAGHPSKGLMQTIGPTFNSYKLPGHGNILNPIDNIIAGVRYAISRYGSIGNVPGIKAVHSGGHYVGY